MANRVVHKSKIISSSVKFLIPKVILIIFPILFFQADLNIDTQEHTNSSYTCAGSDDVFLENYDLVWSDEFNVEGRPDSNNWDYERGFVRNHELQWYQPQNARCENGYLIIEGKRDHILNPFYNPQSKNWRLNNEYANYSSSCLITKGRHEWPSYGYFEIRAQFDTTIGAWPAIWLLGNKNPWPACGEIDMLEFYRTDNVPTLLANVAWGTENEYVAKWSSHKTPLKYFVDKDLEWTNKFHTYSMKWDKKSIRICIDGELMNETMIKETINPDGSNPFTDNKKHYLLLNLAIGSNGGVPDNTKFPIKYKIDYVRVYRYKKGDN